jgi:hypothetical protein
MLGSAAGLVYAIGMLPVASASTYVDVSAEQCVRNPLQAGICVQPDRYEQQTYNDTTYPGPGAFPRANAAVNSAQVVTGSGAVFQASASSTASSDYGVLKVFGAAGSMGGVSSSLTNNSSGRATAAWYDDIRVTSNSHAANTEAMMTVHFSIYGGFHREGSRVSPYDYVEGFTAATEGTWSAEVNNNSYFGYNRASYFQNGYTDALSGNDVYNTSAGFGDFTVTVPIRLGNLFDVSMRLDGRAAALTWGDNANAVSAFSLGDSAYWGGISGITVNGQSIDFDLSSTSGHDWRQSSIPSAVPAPAAVWLLGSGVLGLIGFARSRKR